MSALPEAWLPAARRQGILPADAELPETEKRPWPVLLLTVFGAWLAVLPLGILTGLVFAEFLRGSHYPLYVIGMLALAIAGIALRSERTPPFVEQMAVPVLIVGLGCVSIALTADASFRIANGVIVPLLLALAGAIPRPWIRILFGMQMALSLLIFVVPGNSAAVQPWGQSVLNLMLLAWAGLLWLQWTQVRGSNARLASLFESLACGWMLTLLVCLMLLAGSSFMLTGALGFGPHGSGLPPASAELQLWVLCNRIVSVAMTLAAFGVLRACWLPAFRLWLFVPLLVPLAVLVLLSQALPMLGAALLALAVLLVSGRLRLAGFAALAVVWIVGSFYYNLHWTLADKALLLAVGGALSGALLWWAQLQQRRERQGQENAAQEEDPARPPAEMRTDAPANGPKNAPSNVQENARATGGTPALAVRLAPTALIGSALLCLILLNGAIWQKQQLLAHGERVLLELRPVDPRSLMAGDYMALSFVRNWDWRDLPFNGAQRVKLVARRDARGVASLLRQHQAGQALAPGEFLLELTPKGRRWVVVSDAWHFEEGRGDHYAAARYGEFRVLPDGRALLVGLADKDLKLLNRPAGPIE